MKKIVGILDWRRRAVVAVLTAALVLGSFCADPGGASAADQDYALAVSADTGGSVSGTPGGRYAEGRQILVAAVPNPGYAFSGWDVSVGVKISYAEWTGSSGEGVIAFAMPAQAVTLKASFTPSGTSVVPPPTVPPAVQPGAKLPALSKLKVTKVKAGKKKLTVTWKKAAASQKVKGYQVAYRVFKVVKTKAGKKKKSKIKAGKWKVKSVKAAKKSYVVKKLKKGKRYQVRVRSWRVENGKKKYGKWSAAKKSKKVK